MWIDKFQSEVLIEDQHPLAIAQRAKASVAAVVPVAEQPAVAADTHPASAQTASPTPETPVADVEMPPAAPRKRRR